MPCRPRSIGFILMFGTWSAVAIGAGPESAAPHRRDSWRGYPRSIPLATGEAEPRYEQVVVEATDGTKLIAHEWRSPRRLAAGPVVVFCHGIGMHGEPYGAVAPAWTRRGMVFFAPDLRGHGRSGGAKGVLADTGTLRADLDRMLESVELRYPGSPIVLLGESMGGLLAADYARQRGERLAGLILLVPAFQATVSTRQAISGLGGLLGSGLVPIDTKGNLSGASRDLGFIRAKRADPLVTHAVAPSYLMRISTLGAQWPAAARQLKLPLLVYVAGKDRVVDNQAVRRVFQQASTPADQKTWHLLPDAFHTLCWDPLTPVLMEEAAAWALERQSPPALRVTDGPDEIAIDNGALEARIRKHGYVTGVAGGSLVDKKTGFRDVGFGLHIVDWIMEPGSDEAYRDRLPEEMVYRFNNLYHGKGAKRSIEGPQMCTKAGRVHTEIVRGPDFVAIRLWQRYTTAAPGKKTGSLWTQWLVFPRGERFFLSSDRIDAVNDSDAMFLRIDMPGHIRHNAGDTFSRVYLSYLERTNGPQFPGGLIPSSAFLRDFAPDERFHYRRDRLPAGARPPDRFIRAYQCREPRTGRDGPWLAGMTLEPSLVSEAWCHQRGYVCMIEEYGERPVRAGESLGAAFLVGFFDSIDQMQQIYDRYRGQTRLEVTPEHWRLLP